MPIVTVDPADYTRNDLKSAPADPNREGDENGYVMLRPLPYGMKLTRADKALRMSMRQDPKQPMDRQPKGGAPPSSTIDLETAQEWTTHYDFAYCIGDHNLLDKNGNRLDFSSPMALKMLNPKVGAEISNLIDSLNNDEDEESMEDFLKRATTSSATDSSTSSTEGSISPSPVNLVS